MASGMKQGRQVYVQSDAMLTPAWANHEPRAPLVNLTPHIKAALEFNDAPPTASLSTADSNALLARTSGHDTNANVMLGSIYSTTDKCAALNNYFCVSPRH